MRQPADGWTALIAYAYGRLNVPAVELMSQGTEVLGIDTDEGVVQRVSDRLTHAAVADTGSVTSRSGHAALDQLRHVASKENIIVDTERAAIDERKALC